MRENNILSNLWIRGAHGSAHGGATLLAVVVYSCNICAVIAKSAGFFFSTRGSSPGEKNFKGCWMSTRAAKLTAGCGLVLILVLTPIVHFKAMESLRAQPAPGFALTTAVVALALYRVFAVFHKQASAVASILRIVYALVFLPAVTRLFSLYGSSDLQTVNHFDGLWGFSLIIFEFHLLFLGSIAMRESSALKWIGVLLFIAGAGYIFDSIVVPVGFAVGFEMATVAFIGEVALIIWLLWTVRTVKRVEEGDASTSVSFSRTLDQSVSVGCYFLNRLRTRRTYGMSVFNP